LDGVRNTVTPWSTNYSSGVYFSYRVDSVVTGTFDYRFHFVVADTSVDWMHGSSTYYGPPAPAPSGIAGIGSNLPVVYALHGNYPNPFNPLTSITYDLPKQSTVKITIFDVRGRMVRTLFNGVQDAARVKMQWNGQDQAGRILPSGLYHLKVEAKALDGSESFRKTLKMCLMK